MGVVGRSQQHAADAATTWSSERRDQAARRFKTFWPTSLRILDEVRRAHVLNISCTGAKVHAHETMHLGDTLEIEIGGVWHVASVRWRNDQTFGVAFLEPIAGRDLTRSLTER